MLKIKNRTYLYLSFMKKLILLFLLFLFSSTIFSQSQKARVFGLSEIIEIADMSKEAAYSWLTEDDFFNYVKKDSYGHIYGLNYNSFFETSLIWVRKPLNEGEIIVEGNRNVLNKVLDELKPKIITSRLNDNGKPISIYSFNKKEIIVYINPKQEIIIHVMKRPDTSVGEQVRRYGRILNEN